MTENFCGICDLGCDFVKNHDHETCCKCDPSVEENKYCHDCVMDYIDSIFDRFDKEAFRKPPKSVRIWGVEL